MRAACSPSARSKTLTAEGWRWIVYDHRGAGESPVDPAEISVEAMIEVVFGVLDALGVERCVLAGESQGGAIAQYPAARQLPRFAGLVLSAPTSTGRREVGPAFPDLCRSDYPAAAGVIAEQWRTRAAVCGRQPREGR
jgi:pimeloyl-ACP methyl ester carboxylesterase